MINKAFYSRLNTNAKPRNSIANPQAICLYAKLNVFVNSKVIVDLSIVKSKVTNDGLGANTAERLITPLTHHTTE